MGESRIRPQKMDTAVDTNGDLVLQQLKKLREGRGLTEGRLKLAGAVMSALGTSDPTDGLQRLMAILDDQEDGERLRALRVDFGLSLVALLMRDPTPRERDWLGDRRSGYAEVVERDVKTLARWSDAEVADLRARLISDTFNGNLYVVAAVDGDRIAGITVTEEDLGQEGDEIQRRSTDITNKSEGSSVPALIYAFPRDWRPANLHMAVVFRGGSKPSGVWAAQCDSLMEMPFATERYPLEIQDDTASCRFERPRRDRVYSITWVRPGLPREPLSPAH